MLAGGLGTRLRSHLPEGVPKALAIVGGRPIIDHVLTSARDEAIGEIVLLLGVGADAVMDHVGDQWNGIPVRAVVERRPLGTGGALRHARALLAPRFLLTNSDTVVGYEPAALLGLLEEAPVGMTLAAVAESRRFGYAIVEDDRVIGIAEKSTSGPGLVNAGVYACRRDIIDLLPPGVSSFEVDLLQSRVPLWRPAFRLAAPPFFDIGIPEDWAAADRYLSGHGV